MSKTKSTHNGTKGGDIGGKPHTKGGTQAVIVDDNDRPIELELEEVIICKNAVKDPAKYEFEGQQLTNKEILSRINQSGGGVPIVPAGSTHMRNGGQIGSIRKDFMKDALLGKERKLSLPTGEKRKTRYAIVDISNIIASHNERNFCIKQRISTHTRW